MSNFTRIALAPELVTIELARLFQNSTEWERRFKRYDQLQDAGLSCEEAARIVCVEQPEISRRETKHEERQAA